MLITIGTQRVNTLRTNRILNNEVKLLFLQGVHVASKRINKLTYIILYCHMAKFNKIQRKNKFITDKTTKQ